MSNQRQVVAGLLLYAADYNDSFPARSPPINGNELNTQPMWWSSYQRELDLHLVAEKYLHAPWTLRCPMSVDPESVEQSWPLVTDGFAGDYYSVTINVYAGWMGQVCAGYQLQVDPVTLPLKTSQAPHSPLTSDCLADLNGLDAGPQAYHWYTFHSRDPLLNAGTALSPPKDPLAVGWQDGHVDLRSASDFEILNIADGWGGRFYWPKPQ